MRRLTTMILLLLTIASAAWSADGDYTLQVPKGLPKMKVPKNNPLTEAKISLGKQLFFDDRLSRDDTISCASCHDPEKGWSNGEQFATGIRGQVGGRNAPTIINAGYQYYQFWDGRAQHVEGQALGPVQSPIEMDLTLDELETKLGKIEGYRTQFKAVFKSEVTRDGIAKAIGAFERTILSGDAPYDRFKAGDEKALSESAQRGKKLFFNKAHCSACHSGGNFSDGAFHNIGVGMDKEKPDVGRYSVSKLLGDRGSFRTPTLREVAKSGPYMHDGSIKTLKEVVEYYNQGGVKNDQLDESIFPLNLTDQDVSDLVLFLTEGLSSAKYPMVKTPALPK